MKVLKTQSGGISIIISKEELLGFIDVNEFQNPKEETENPFKNLNKNTIHFYNVIKSTFGFNEIDRKDKRLLEIERTLFIKDLHQVCKSLKSKGLVEITKNGEGSTSRIKSIKLLK